jgi:para-aminobenzoate synthetase component 1
VRPTPEEVFALIADKQGSAWLDGGDDGEWSILVWDPVEVVTELNGWPASGRRLTRQSDPGGAAPFAGGCVGWIGYGAGAAVESVPAGRPTPEPAVWLGAYRGGLCFHHPTRTWHATGEPDVRREGARLLAAAEPLSAPPAIAPRTTRSTDRSAFLDAVCAALEAIAAGDVYQVNLSRPVWVDAPGDAWAAYRRLRAAAPAAHGALLRPSADLAIASISPETFLACDGAAVHTVPIKGTRAGGDPSGAELLGSEKELAELTMIVDLCRNDLGRVALPGSVTVGPRVVHSHRYVWHASQRVSAILTPGLDVWDALAAAFPPGSVTGCPKVRACELIAALEPHPRGVYCGAIGFSSSSGRSGWSVAIRTAVLQPHQARFHVGAGIVADSDPAAEWDETCHKAAPLLAALAGR